MAYSLTQHEWSLIFHIILIQVVLKCNFSLFIIVLEQILLFHKEIMNNIQIVYCSNTIKYQS